MCADLEALAVFVADGRKLRARCKSGEYTLTLMGPGGTVESLAAKGPTLSAALVALKAKYDWMQNMGEQ